MEFKLGREGRISHVSAGLDGPEVMLLSVLPTPGSLGWGRFVGIGVVLELLLTTRADDSQIFTCGSREAGPSRGGRYVYRLRGRCVSVETVRLIIEVHGIVGQRIVFHDGQQVRRRVVTKDFHFDVWGAKQMVESAKFLNEGKTDVLSARDLVCERSEQVGRLLLGLHVVPLPALAWSCMVPSIVTRFWETR